MNVDVARELAARGYLAFRFDASGLGESPPAPGGRENRIYSLDAVGDVQAAMDVLEERHRVSRFVLVGLCSGAYAAFHAAVADARIVGQMLLSPYAFEWKEGDPVTPQTRQSFHSTRFYAKSILDGQVWRRALRGDVEVRAIARVLVERLKTRVDAEVPKLMARLRGRLRPQNDVERAFQAMSDRGVETLMVLSFDDGGLDMVSGYLGTDARKMRGRRNFVFQVMDDADHTFTTLASQGKLLAMLTGYMSRCFP
jgi:pimeloyl-ACP methyl ester carboxylesterase